jgi:ADP-ribose pyrophosphatase YjhB (NUDIX family)
MNTFIYLKKALFTNKLDTQKRIKDKLIQNVYKGIELDLGRVYEDNREDTKDLEDNIASILSELEIDGIRSVTVTVPDYLSHNISIFTKRGFYYHHCSKSSLILCKWLDKSTPNKLPHYAQHLVGVGACIITKDLEFLLIKEKYSPYSQRAPWKFVTGLVESGESIHDATLREVKEEVNLDVKYIGTICVSELFPNMQKVSDICFFNLCYLEDPSTIKLDDVEVAEYKFYKKDELLRVIQSREATLMTMNTLNKILPKLNELKEYDERRIVEKLGLLRIKNETEFNKKYFNYMNIFH